MHVRVDSRSDVRLCLGERPEDSSPAGTKRGTNLLKFRLSMALPVPSVMTPEERVQDLSRTPCRYRAEESAVPTR